MGNSNSSHRHRPHITDPLPMDPAAWSSQSTYPGNLKGPRPMQTMMMQQPHPSGGPDTVDGPRSMGVIRNGRSSSYDQFDQECMIQQQSHPDARFARYLPPLGVVPQVEAAQPRKIRVLPTLNGTGHSGGINGDQGVPKLRPTDNGLALQKVGTLHVPANRKLTELQITKPTSPPIADESSCSPPASTDDTRSPTPDYPESSNGKTNNRGSRPRSKKNQKAPVAPSTPALSAKSMEMGEQPSSQGKRGKLKLFKTKSDPKRSESDRMRARSMEYLRTDLADDMQEVRRRHSREDLSGDESILAVTKNGPVTVFSSQKKLDDDDWEEMPRINKKKETESSPPKQFYFGMTPGDVAVATVPPPPALDLDEESRRVMEEFDAVLSESRTKSEEDPLEIIAQPKVKSGGGRRIIKHSPPPPPAYMDDDDDDDESQDIALNLRPTLPKKPQQLPRFSPSAAWRALGHQPDSIYSRKLDSSKASDMSAMDLSDEEDDEDVMEERINKNSRPVAPHPPRNINEKSADSGISGDAGSPDAGAMKPLAMSSPVPQQQQQNWTPQQDLIDDSSSSDADVTPEPKIMVKRNTSSGAGMIPAPKIIPKSQMFNDSTDTPGSSVSGRQGNNNSRGRKYRKRSENQPEAPQKYNSLRKLKRSVSGAFATAFRRGSKDSPEESSSLDDGNWVLSRSAPNSVVNGSVGESSLRKLHRSEADLLHQAQLQAQSMALPGMLIHQYPAYSQPVLTQRIVYLPQYDSRPNRHSSNQRYRMPEQAEMMRRAKSADALYLESQKQQQQGLMRRISNPGKKFTFQSTVRVQEKRALEQRLSREAELKERKRLQEVQAMQRVEEEFQRKRAREKANIRQQLRILQYSSEQDPNSARLDPEGAPSSISHNRTSSDEIHQAKISAAVRSPPAEHKRSNAAVILMAGRRITPPEEQQQQRSKVHQDYRREAVISSSRTRSAAPPPPPSFQTHPERNNNNNNNPPVKKPSNIYKRLAEIASEEESICSPPPVPNVVVKASPSRGNPGGGGHYQMNGGGRRSNPPPPPQAVNGVNNSSSNNNNKVMTQELSEFRQERREYRDYRSPRQHITTQQGRYGPSSSGQPRSGPTSSASSSSINHSGSNKMQSDNYRWEFAHGGRAIGGGRTTYVAPPPVPVWHHHHHGPPSHQVVRHHHDYFYKIPPPGEVVMMHRTPQQHRHH